MNRTELEGLPAATVALRAVRSTTLDDITDITDDELAAAVRWLRAASHNARQGAATLERLIIERTAPKGTPCSNSPTPPPTPTAAPTCHTSPSTPENTEPST